MIPRALQARLRLAGVSAVCLIACGVASSGWADDTVARIEEDWQLVVNSPDADSNGPQVTCVISPGTLDSGYCAFDVNYATQPDYAAGGMQMHVWSPNCPIVTRNLSVQGQLSSLNETVTWTQAMSLADDRLTFQVLNGQSTSWGAFGDGEASLGVQAANPTLANYTPDQSVKNSGVSFASNLVDSLTLKAVRYYNSAGQLLRTDSTPRTIAQ